MASSKEVQEYLKEKVKKINKILGVNSIDEGMKKLDEMEKIK